jgi:hypothetical protein
MSDAVVGKKYKDTRVPGRVFKVLSVEEGYALVELEGRQFTAEMDEFESGRYKELT